MRVQDLDRRSIDHVLSTTRAVRRRLDLERPVPLEVVRECLELGLQAPTGFNRQLWRWIVITDRTTRQAIGEIYRRVDLPFIELEERGIAAGDDQTRRVAASSRYLAEHLAEVPVHVIPCSLRGVSEARDVFQGVGLETDLWNMAASAVYGAMWPAAWSFMLALRSRGLGSSLTMMHLGAEPEVARLLGIPEGVSQAGLIPVAYFKGEDFRPAARRSVDEVTYYDRWDRTRPVSTALTSTKLSNQASTRWPIRAGRSTVTET